ncbi:hypothetical protein HG537_0F03460 [Torulaspora globosa]|uniref:MI domain-containing protein n=1 Tax=Torulaspora globosa TaxID=48254 RepID=A0A7H9HYF0_9SACH|nr:hypothetical protein HG537_0F03460 [Torulaspora sp. CBS 2947]
MSSKHGIRLPGSILDELKSQDYENDERFKQVGKIKGKRRGGPQLSRKERRKQQRLDKKHVKRDKKLDLGRKSEQAKGKGEGDRNGDRNDVGIPSDDELSDFAGCDDEDLDEEELEERENEIQADNDQDTADEEIDHEMSVDETIAALKALKEKKGKQKETGNLKKSDRKRKNDSERGIELPIAPSDRAAAERDEMDMQYYAKKLGLKGKNKRIRAKDEFDAVGGLLEGLEFFEKYGDEDDEYGNFAQDDGSSGESQGGESDEQPITGLPSSDDEISSGDFDEFDEDDLDEEEWQQLRELEGEDASDGDENSEPTGKTKKKPNPLVAPVASSTENYVPPSLRKKQLENSQESSVQAEVRKNVKSSLNKLSDSNITIIVGSLNDLFDKYARQLVTEAIVEQVVDIVAQRNKLLDSLIMNYSAVLYSLWKLRGIDIGASFIQLSVESFLSYYESQNRILEDKKSGSSEEVPLLLSKEPVNLLTLIAYCYNFGLTSSKLIYDLIHLFVDRPNELTTELLLKVISVSGSLIRGDDPAALRDIIAVLLSNVKGIANQPPRMKFLLDTISDLKNNRLKPSMLATSHSSLKKKLQSVIKTNSSVNDALLVSIDDIRNVETKGKWWLVGASWKGNMANASEELPEANNKKPQSSNETFLLDDDLLDDIPDWSEIARQRRMNTDIRRAIFISIMSAQDFMDAFTKLEKLNLKKKQTLEISRVLLHCLSEDSDSNGYNPYYALLAKRLCENQQTLVKSFGFLFWDIMKEFEDDGLEKDLDEEEDLDEDTKLKRLANQGKFFGFLVAEHCLKLDILKHVSLISGLNADGNRFMEMFIFQFLLTSAKKSEIKSKDPQGNKTITFKQDFLSQLLDAIKVDNKALILKGLKYFMKKSFKYVHYIVGSPGDKSYERDLRRLKWAVPNFRKLIDEQLETIDI